VNDGVGLRLDVELLRVEGVAELVKVGLGGDGVADAEKVERVKRLCVTVWL